MNKSLASFVFSGETLFCLPNESVSMPTDEAKPSTQKKEDPLPKKDLLKRILILTDSLTAIEKEFLLKVMASVNITESQMDIVPFSDFESYNLSNTTQSQEIISFGGLLQYINISENYPKYQNQVLNNKKIVVADSLSVVDKNAANEKRNLWTALKKMYGLS